MEPRFAAPGRWAGGRAALVLLLACAWLPAIAQTGGLRVKVTDPAGDPLPGAIVTIRNDQGLIGESSLATDRQGSAEFPILRPGQGYSIEVTFPGYAVQSLKDLRVRLGETGSLPVSMSVSVQERVEVKASRQVVDLEETAHVSRFGDQFLADLPVQSRQYQNVLKLAPGVLDPDEDGNPNVHGARSRDFKTVVNGVSNVDPLTGNWLSNVNPDSIEELEVIPAGAGVEFGRAQGGFARVLQKQGSNSFEGVFNLLLASSHLDASPDSGTQPDYSTIQPSFQISGPILRDRLWYRFSAELVRREDPVDTVRAVGVNEQRQTIQAYQLTWQASPRNKVALQFQSDPKSLTNANLSSRVPPEASQRLELGGPTWSLTWTAAQSPRLLIESNVAWQEGRSNVLPSEPGVTNSCVVNPLYPVLDQAQCYHTNFNVLSGSYYISSRDRRQRLTVGTHADYYAGKFWGGTHRFKAGFVAENERYFRNMEQRPDFDFTIYKGFGVYGIASYRIPFPDVTTSEVTGFNWGVFLEDQYRPASNLTLTLGVRLDHEQIDSLGWSPFDPLVEAQTFQARRAGGLTPLTALFQESFTAYQDVTAYQAYIADVLNVDFSVAPIGAATRQSVSWLKRRQPADIRLRNDNVAPRFAVAWDPTGDGKTKLSFSAGRYYDKIFLGIPLIELEPATTVIRFYADQIIFPHFVIADPTYRLGEGTPLSTRVVDRGLSTPYQDEFSAGFEREIGAETAVRLTYIHRRFEDQLQDVDINHAPADFGRCLTRSPWLDTSRGPDGTLDDCYQGADGLADQYALNPGWGEILLVGNLNTTRYEAYVLEFVRRLYRNWQLDASYTWSEAIGDAEDFDQLLGNDRRAADDERGLLSYDQTHVIKVSGTTYLRSGWRFGGTVQWESGLPYSTEEPGLVGAALPLGYYGEPTSTEGIGFPSGTRNDQRSQSFWTINARTQREWAVGSVTFGISADAFNLLDDDTIRTVNVISGTAEVVRRSGRRFQLGLRAAF